MSFKRSDIIYYLRLLSGMAREERLILEITFYGGTCLLLAYDYQERKLTKDIDAIIHPREPAEAMIKRIAATEGLPEDWLDEGVRQFLSPKGETYVTRLPELKTFSNLKISFPSAAYLIAMKIRSSVRSRFGYDGDLDDLKFLCRKTGLKSVDEAQAHLDRFFDDEVIPERALEAIKEVISEKNK